LNPKEEAFAQAVARGMNYVEAAKLAGYAGDRGNSSRMARRPKIAARILEIRATLPPPESAAVSEAEAELPGGGGDRIAQLEQLRAAGLQHRQVNAAVAAQREILRHEREAKKGKEKGADPVGIAKQLIPLFRTIRNSTAPVEEIVARWMGLVFPAERAAIGLPPLPSPNDSNGHGG
jgi:phage terminase small subunit